MNLTPPVALTLKVLAPLTVSPLTAVAELRPSLSAFGMEWYPVPPFQTNEPASVAAPFFPPGTVAFNPLASLIWPPPTVAVVSLAVLLLPPTVAFNPLASSACHRKLRMAILFNSCQDLRARYRAHMQQSANSQLADSAFRVRFHPRGHRVS